MLTGETDSIYSTKAAVRTAIKITTAPMGSNISSPTIFKLNLSIYFLRLKMWVVIWTC